MSEANNNINISFRFGGRELNADGSGRISIRLLKSAFSPVITDGVPVHDRLTTNELIHLAHQLRKTRFNDSSQHVGFDYTLDFPLAKGYGFPYVLDYDNLT